MCGFLASAGITFEGDSITAGVGLTSTTLDFASIVFAEHRWDTGFRNFAVNGSTISVNAPPYNATADSRAPLVDAGYLSGLNRNIEVVLLGSNDLKLLGQSVATVFAELKAYCQGRQAAGFKVVILTILPRENNAFNAQRNPLNVLIRGDSSFYDALADVGDTGTTMGADSAWSDVSLYPDAIHPSAAGHALLAPTVNAAVASLLP